MRASLATASALALALLLPPRFAFAQAPTATPAPFGPYRRAGAEILLPVLEFQGQDDVCDSWIDVQNLGADDCKVALVAWGEPGFCPPQSAGPLRSECGGLIKPGAAWTFSGAMIPAGSRSGVLFRLSAERVDRPDGTADDNWSEPSIADIACRNAFFYLGLADEGPARLMNAYRHGLLFDGIDFAAAAGTGTLAATVTRTCPGASTPSRDVTASYNGLALSRLGSIDPVQGGYVVYAPDAHVVTGGDGAPGVAGGTTYLYVQNAALQCASVDVWFAPRGGCGRSRLCAAALRIAPLETLHVDSADCGPPNGEGAMWVRSTQPVAVVAERVVADTIATYVGAPTLLRAAYDPAKAAPASAGRAIGAAFVSNGDPVHGDLTSRITVANVSPIAPARIRLTLRDPSGSVRAARVDWLCPLGSGTFDLAAMRDVPRGWSGSARVEALGAGDVDLGGDGAVGPTGTIGVTGAAVAGIVRVTAPDGASAGAYPMAALADGPATATARRPSQDNGVHLAADAPGQGISLIALPTIARGAAGRTSTIVVHNTVAVPGTTWLMTTLGDANGIVGYACDRLEAGAQLAIDLDALAYLGRAFRGAAVISAEYWAHDTFEDAGQWTGTWVGLEAVAVDAAPDGGGAADAGTTAYAGIPLRRRDVVGDTNAAWPAPPLCDSPALFENRGPGAPP